MSKAIKATNYAVMQLRRFVMDEGLIKGEVTANELREASPDRWRRAAWEL